MAELRCIATPRFVERGSGKIAVFLSPVLPIWDNGRYFDPLTNILNSHGYRVVVFDTLSLIPHLDVNLQDLARAWDHYLGRLGAIDLLGGAAMGGSVVQTALGGVSSSNHPDILLFSSPTVCDAPLRDQLLALANTATKRGAGEALKLLSHLVRPLGGSGEAPDATNFTVAEEAIIVHRLKRGFEILASVDAASPVTEYRGRLLHLYGEASRLASEKHIVTGSQKTHRKVSFANCGMRPLSDALAKVEPEIVNYLAHGAH